MENEQFTLQEWRARYGSGGFHAFPKGSLAARILSGGRRVSSQDSKTTKVSSHVALDEVKQICLKTKKICGYVVSL